MLLAPHEPVFKFEDEAHRYTLDGRLLPSITQILDEVGYIDKEYFTDEHRYRGTYVHWCVRLLNENRLNMDDVAPKFRGYVEGYMGLVNDKGIVAVEFEKPRYHPKLLFAGTPDIVTKEAIWELKTGQIHEWVAQQTIGQEMLVHVGQPRPKRLRRFAVRLNKNGTYDEPIEFKNHVQDETVFKINVAAVRNKPLYGAPMLRGLK